MGLSTDSFATYRLLSSELAGRGYTISSEVQNDNLFTNFISPEGRVWRTAAAHIHYPFTSSAALQLSRDKASAYSFAQSKNVPIPFTRRIEYGEVIEENELESIVQKFSPLIVKPNNSSLSKGLTMHIETSGSLESAIEFARLVKESDVLVQQQVFGEEIRFVIIKGRVVAAMLRQTPRIVGDGVKTIQQLIEAENTERQKLSFPYISYPQLTEDLINEKYLHDQTVLGEGAVLEFSRATMIRDGCSVYEILDRVHPSYIEEIEKLVEGIDASFLVADFLMADYQGERYDNNHWFLEFNSSPVLKLFYGSRDGNVFDIVPLIADLIEESLA